MGGDRSRRHNRLRSHVFHFCARAGLFPELEKPGLLQPRPYQGALPENGVRVQDTSARRPADVYLPRWRQGFPMALDFAVTSGLRPDVVAQSAQSADAAVSHYEDFKRNHLDTARTCADEGLGFSPIVMEAHGGSWGPVAGKVFAELAQTKSLLTGEPQDHLLGQLYQNLSVILHRENARSILKRSRTFTHNLDHILSSATTLQAEAADAASTATT